MAHQCACVTVANGVSNRCNLVVASNDVPFCKYCEGRHAQWRDEPSVVITHVDLQEI